MIKRRSGFNGLPRTIKNLPPEVMTAFQNHLFLISNDKVQHFPARDLTQAEMIQRVKEN